MAADQYDPAFKQQFSMILDRAVDEGKSFEQVRALYLELKLEFEARRKAENMRAGLKPAC